MKTSHTNNSNNEEFLNSLKKENSFAVPEGYFENLPQTIVEKCVDSSKTNYKVYFLFKPKFYFPLFAGIAVLVVALLVIKNFNSGMDMNKQNVQLANNADEYSYLENLIDNNELDESDILEVIADDTSKQIIPVMIDPTALQNAMLQNSGDSTVITYDDIMQYLLEEEEISDDPYYNL